MAAFAFPAIFKLKFIKHKVWLVLLYSLISAAAATVAIVCGAMILYISVWMAIGGGAAGVTTFIGISGSLLMLILIAANAWVLVSYGKICPNCFEPAPKLSIILASAAVVLRQGALRPCCSKDRRQQSTRREKNWELFAQTTGERQTVCLRGCHSWISRKKSSGTNATQEDHWNVQAVQELIVISWLPPQLIPSAQYCNLNCCKLVADLLNLNIWETLNSSHS